MVLFSLKEQVGYFTRRHAVQGITPRLTGAGARSAQGTNTGHQNREAMASVGVRVEPTVRLRSVGTVADGHRTQCKAPHEEASASDGAFKDSAQSHFGS